MKQFKDKEKITIYVDRETIDKADELFEKLGFKSRSEFIDKAINFYAGYRSSENFLDYYPEVIVSTVKAAGENFEDRMASLMFKNAVELNMVLHILAASCSVNAETISKLQGKCIEEVQRLRGNISFEEAYKYQKGE